MVRPPGIEPGSMALQATAMTTSAKDALVLLDGVEPSFPPYQRGVLPLHTMGAIFGTTRRIRTSGLYVRSVLL